ncbi:hypothetical protein SQ03_16675, partial [Methylobacterium platani JCM 14648]
MFDDAENRPRPQASHQIGQDLSALSVSDLDERIEALRRRSSSSRAISRRRASIRSSRSETDRAERSWPIWCEA